MRQLYPKINYQVTDFGMFKWLEVKKNSGDLNLKYTFFEPSSSIDL